MDKIITSLKRNKTRLLNKHCDNLAEFNEIQDKLNYIETELKIIETKL